MIRSTPAIARADMIRCALCDRAPCDEACGKLNPAERLRNIWFGNEESVPDLQSALRAGLRPAGRSAGPGSDQPPVLPGEAGV